MKSAVMTEHDEFTPEDKLDMAAANSPATTSPLIPGGNPTTMYRGKSLSAALATVCPSASNSGWMRK